MSVNKNILLLIIFFLSHGLKAQFTESISTSRPGASFTPFTTGSNIFQLQTGFIYDTDKNNTSNYSKKGLNYALLVRYGISEVFEVRSSILLRNDKETTSGIESSYGGLALWDIGFRWNVIDGTESGTSFGIQSEFRIDVGPVEYKPERQFANRTIALFTTPITNWLSFTTNLGITWYDGVNTNGLYTLNLGFPLSPKIGGFIEMFGTFNSNNFGKSFDTGIGYLANDNLLFDFSLGFVDRIQTNFFDLGLSWRISTKK